MMISTFFVVTGLFLLGRATFLAIFGDFLGGGYTLLASLFCLSFLFEEMWGDWIDEPIFSKGKTAPTGAPSTSMTSSGFSKDALKEILANPSLSAVGLLGGTATLLFVGAYLTHSWKQFHLALGVTLASLVFTVLCKEEWKTWAKNYCQKYWKELWLAVSIAFATLTFGHCWGAVAIISSLVSTFFAAITVGDGWGKTGEISKNLFSGKYGLDTLLFVLFLACLGTAIFLYVVGESSVSPGGRLYGLETRTSAELKGLALLFFVGSVLTFVASTLVFTKNRLVK